MESWFNTKMNSYRGEQYRFKSCCSTWLVVLEIIDGTITNESRSGVIDDKYAHFRGNVFRVIDIVHKFVKDKQISAIKSSYYNEEKRLNYIIGQVVVSDFNHNLNVTASNGIHYFKTYDAAYQYELDKVRNGRLMKWNHHGRKLSEQFFRNNYLHGNYITWYHNGTKRSEQCYQNGVINNIIEWGANGIRY